MPYARARVTVPYDTTPYHTIRPSLSCISSPFSSSIPYTLSPISISDHLLSLPIHTLTCDSGQRDGANNWLRWSYDCRDGANAFPTTLSTIPYHTQPLDINAIARVLNSETMLNPLRNNGGTKKNHRDSYRDTRWWAFIMRLRCISHGYARAEGDNLPYLTIPYLPYSVRAALSTP